MEKDAYIFTMHNHHKMEKLDHSLERYFPTLKKIGVRNFFSFLVVALLATGVLLTINQVKQQQETRGSAATLDTNCADATTVPVGALPTQPKPFWCYTNLVAAPTTRVSGTNSWEDNFNSGTMFGHFNDGELDYRIFNNLGGPGDPKSIHIVHNNHWMVDFRPGDPTLPADWNVSAGTTMRPNQSFTFQNGKLVIEADVAAGETGYEPVIWPEIDWSTAPEPTVGKPLCSFDRADFNPTGKCGAADNLYLYGQFSSQWTSGCRVQPSRGLTCAFENPTPTLPTGAEGKCSAIPNGHRIWELSWFQQCGTVHSGGQVFDDKQNTPWRVCKSGSDDDMFCRDRFRFEWSKNGLVVYVNGVKFFEDSGWPASQQLPDAIVNGTTPVYAYFGEFGGADSRDIFRIHWGRLAVNPANGPNAAPSFCLGEPQNTCPTMGHGGTPIPTSLVSSSPTPTMAQHTTPTPTTQPTQPPLTGSASMSLQPATQSVPASSAFTVMVHENSGTTPVNATQAVVTYPTALLRFDGFDTTTMQSAFPVMAQQTESGGTITIARGTTTPVSGNQHIVGLKFSARATTASTAAITLTSSSVLLSSQTNTNILSQRNNATVNITVTKTGDLNNDNKIDILDLSIFLNKWNSTDSASDMNHDGTVNILDLSILLSQWGK